MTSPASSTMTIILTSQSRLFQTSTPLAPSCSCKVRGGAMSFRSTFPRQRCSRGAVSTACVRASEESAHMLLGVAQGASKAEIKKAYRRLALQYHPDVCRGDHCSAHFQLINSAYEALMANMAGSPPPSHSSSDHDSERSFIDPNDDFLDELEEWMGLEGAGTYDFSTPIDDSS